jgi:hypothetical protein
LQPNAQANSSGRDADPDAALQRARVALNGDRPQDAERLAALEPFARRPFAFNNDGASGA